MRDGTGDGVEARKVQCQDCSREAPAHIYIYIYIYGFGPPERFHCRFIVAVRARATFLNTFLGLDVWIWQKVFVIYRFWTLLCSECYIFK